MPGIRKLEALVPTRPLWVHGDVVPVRALATQVRAQTSGLHPDAGLTLEALEDTRSWFALRPHLSTSLEEE